jgi:hypothetical protein
MSFSTWFSEIKLKLNAKLNYRKLTKKYLQDNRRKAAEEIRHLEDFTYWPIAQAKTASVLINQKSKLGRKKRERKLHYLPFYSYQKKAYLQNKVAERPSIKLNKARKLKKYL